MDSTVDSIIRRVKQTDIDALTRVEAACFPASEAASREELLKRLETFPDSFFVAEAKAGVIGFINGCATDEKTIRDEMFSDSSLHAPKGAYQAIFGLSVLPEYRKQGMGEQLMKRLIQDAREKGRIGLILTCKDKLLHYYERFGFVNCGVSASVHGGAVWYDMILEF